MYSLMNSDRISTCHPSSWNLFCFCPWMGESEGVESGRFLPSWLSALLVLKLLVDVPELWRDLCKKLKFNQWDICFSYHSGSFPSPYFKWILKMWLGAVFIKTYMGPTISRKIILNLNYGRVLLKRENVRKFSCLTNFQCAFFVSHVFMDQPFIVIKIW